MLNIMEVHETNQMIEQEKLDVRTITMGISLLDCADADVDVVADNIYRKITTYAKDLVATGEAIERDYGIPIVNKRITVTPISLVGASACKSSEDFVKLAHALDRAAKQVGVDLIGGYSALVSKSNDSGRGDAHPLAAAGTERNRHRLLVGQRRFHQNRHRHERRRTARPHHQGHRLQHA